MFCETCEKKPTCKEICKEVKSYLKSQGIKSADWIRPRISPKKLKKERRKGIFYSKHREIPFSSLKTRDYDGNYKASVPSK